MNKGQFVKSIKTHWHWRSDLLLKKHFLYFTDEMGFFSWICDFVISHQPWRTGGTEGIQPSLRRYTFQGTFAHTKTLRGEKFEQKLELTHCLKYPGVTFLRSQTQFFVSVENMLPNIAPQGGGIKMWWTNGGTWKSVMYSQTYERLIRICWA